MLLKAPFWVIYALAKFIGLIFYYHRRKRRVAFRNIKLAFPEKSYQELHAILKRSFHYLVLDVIENLIAPRIYPFVTIKGEENITPDGGIFVGIHAGNWETAISLFAHRRTFAIFAKEQKNKELDRFLNEVRVEGKINVVFSIKELIRYLKNDHLIGIVIDHGAEKDAPVVEFFSHLVPTPRGSVYLAKKFNKKIYPDFCYRKNLTHHVSEIGKPIDPSGKSDEEILQSLNKIYEDYLRKYPWEYFWYYKRFKRKLNRDIVILTDRKLGHFKQSRSLLRLLSERKKLIRSRTIEIRYRSQFHRFLADLFATCVSRHCLFSGRLLSWVVDKKTWRALDSVCADLVISAGSIAAPANKLLASYLGAKSVVILRPNVPLRKFDLAVIPEHDRIPGPRAVAIKGALCYPENLEEKISQCKDLFGLPEGKKISFFIGGPLLNKQEFFENLKVFISKVKDFAEKNNYQILLSSSRRTPPAAEKLIEKELKDFKQTAACVLANRQNFDFVFEGFVALAEVAFITTDSISMISESIAINPSTVCVSLGQEGDKHKVFLESIGNEVSFLEKPYDFESIVLRSCQIFAKNKEKVGKAIEELI
ncbi:MAG: mitochondrial fission ELM1 family protein [Candidatus Omnitrophica bacterium]|nr:mitochondrial fission ELM1 family protein [Candidatus Omnitrophota bacterium]MBU2044550.1 mitochondrial fission ELM1 family protein [Candidatus Omnitrophota bacterium]